MYKNEVPEPSKLRLAAKQIPPLYWLAGLIAYIKFTFRLRKANKAYAEKPGVPPPLLRFRVHASLEEWSYLHVGKLTAATLAQCLGNHGVVLKNLDILDFGCGAGRVAVELKKLTQSCRLFGCDIDAEAITWAHNNLVGTGCFEVNSATPPTAYADDFFDVAYSVSVFTHLDEQAQESWLGELARIVKPGGTVIATTHGRLALASCTSSELQALRSRGIAFRVDRKGRFKLDGLPDFYQTTFHAREYVARTWSKFFEVVDQIEGGLFEHQDLIVLRRRPDLA